MKLVCAFAALSSALAVCASAQSTAGSGTAAPTPAVTLAPVVVTPPVVVPSVAPPVVTEGPAPVVAAPTMAPAPWSAPVETPAAPAPNANTNTNANANANAAPVETTAAPLEFVPVKSANDFMSTLKKPTTKLSGYHMSPVHVIQARAQSDMPVWNEQGKRFVSKFGKDLASGFMSAMDTVNTASVEGSLMYVQAECIDYNGRSAENRCWRKNNVQYMVFYEIAFAQTNETLAQYADANYSEYGPMVPMDGGAVTPLKGAVGAGAEYADDALMFNGDDGRPNIGPAVGGERKDDDVRAPYPDNVWFSFPNTCPLSPWANKTSDCRASTRKGLCDLGAMPTGVDCTFNYRILGFLPVDDIVGITSMKNESTGVTYGNFSEFCKDGGVEFAIADGKVESIDFWKNPQDPQANANRSAHMVDLYQAMVAGKAKTSVDPKVLANMLPLPTVQQLTAENPPCYMNVKACNQQFGCKRDKFAQICVVCGSQEEGCVAPPSGFVYPTLEKAVGRVPVDSTKPSKGGNSSTTPDKKTSAASSTASSMIVTVASVLVAAILLR